MDNIFPNHTKIYFNEIPDFLLPFLNAPSIKRLHGIGQHCGTEYTKFFNYKFCQSRFNHSLGVGLIVWNFTKSEKQTLAGFFHDISNSVFSHVGDFFSGDKIKQEATEELTSEIILNDEIIQIELKKLGLKTSEVDDYTLYPIADNKGPQLSADRLEYTLTGGYNLGHISINELKEIYKNITILKNEFGEIELGFSDYNIALKFAELSILNDKNCFSSYESNISMSFLSEILKIMIKNNLLTKNEMFILEEKDVIKKIFESKNEKLIDMWNFFINLNKLEIHKNPPNDNIFFIDSKNKKRYIDPLVKINGNIQRISSLSSNFEKQIQEHKNYPKEFISINYKI